MALFWQGKRKEKRAMKKEQKWKTKNPALVLYTTVLDPEGLLRLHRTERRKARQHYSDKLKGETTR
tara:strand:- start:729 stop:926 length:198 start_codon:yes stop_codon:yes gene_type:complete